MFVIICVVKQAIGLATIYIVRHGETEWNVSRRIQGHFDSSITPQGLTKVKLLAEQLRHIKFDAIFSSDLLRAKRTAEIIRLDRELQVVTKKALRERAYGQFDGMLASQFGEKTRHLFDKYRELSEKEQWGFSFGEGYENDEHVVSRFITFLREVAVGYPSKTILVVSHGALIKTFLAHSGLVTPREARAAMFENAGYVKIESDGADFFIKEIVGFQKK